MNEHRTNLELYYKFVRNCKKCGKPYGYDSKSEDNGYCVVCFPFKSSISHKPKKCPFCEESFVYVENIRIHIRENHKAKLEEE